jgi:hypothetical protein
MATTTIISNRFGSAIIHEPLLVRARLSARNAIVKVMADDMRHAETRRGSVDAEDLELLGWTPGDRGGGAMRRLMMKHRHTAGRARWYPMDRRFVTICSCGKRIEGASRPEADAHAAAHEATYPGISEPAP